MASHVSIIGKGMKITGKVVSEDVIIIGGDIEGELYGNKVVLKKDCQVKGKIYSKSLIIESGGLFDGQSMMETDRSISKLSDSQETDAEDTKQTDNEND